MRYYWIYRKHNLGAVRSSNALVTVHRHSITAHIWWMQLSRKCICCFRGFSNNLCTNANGNQFWARGYEKALCVLFAMVGRIWTPWLGGTFWSGRTRLYGALSCNMGKSAEKRTYTYYILCSRVHERPINLFNNILLDTQSTKHKG